MFSFGCAPTGDREERVDKAKPFSIPKREVWEAFKRVKVNQDFTGSAAPAQSGHRPK